MAVQNESLAADSNVNKLNIFNVTTQFTIQFQNVVDFKQLFLKKSIENPRVTGSIPVQATKTKKPQCFHWGFFLCSFALLVSGAFSRGCAGALRKLCTQGFELLARVFFDRVFVEVHLSNETAGHGGNHVAAFFAAACPAHCQ